MSIASRTLAAMRPAAPRATTLPIVASPDAMAIACPGRSIAAVDVNVKTGDAAPSWYLGRAGADRARGRAALEHDCERCCCEVAPCRLGPAVE